MKSSLKVGLVAALLLAGVCGVLIVIGVLVLADPVGTQAKPSATNVAIGQSVILDTQFNSVTLSKSPKVWAGKFTIAQGPDGTPAKIVARQALSLLGQKFVRYQVELTDSNQTGWVSRKAFDGVE